ncbi:DUF485 domain-containing protein [Paraburkholderia dipogonis]|uniref:DUF485 domain-containing protein n=2 Tax=Paraburkholderia dipogonis TaxID=1211383 RepID=UPI0035EDEFA6
MTYIQAGGNTMTHAATCLEGLSPGQMTASPMPCDVQFQQFVSRRRRSSWTLAASMLMVYFAFILLIAFALVYSVPRSSRTT